MTALIRFRLRVFILVSATLLTQPAPALPHARALSPAQTVAEALKHLRWVKEHGNKLFVEYPLALSEISRIEKSADSTNQ